MNIQEFENELRRCIQVEKDKGVKIGPYCNCALACMSEVHGLHGSMIKLTSKRFDITLNQAWAIVCGWDGRNLTYYNNQTYGPSVSQIDKDWFDMGNNLAVEFGIRQ